MKWWKNRGRRWMFFVAFLMSFQLLWSAAATAAGVDDKIKPVSLFGSGSKTAPEFELRDLNGSTVRLSQYKGERPVLLYFWATWCPYCIAAKPKIAKLREEIGQSEMEILAINVGGGDSLEKVKRYQEAHPVSWPMLFDGEGVATKAYQIQGIPLFVLVDKEGTVAYRGNTLPEDLKKLLK
jgi:peroxiredoxin